MLTSFPEFELIQFLYQGCFYIRLPLTIALQCIHLHVPTSHTVLFSTDGGQLLQPLANQAQSANARSKPDLVIKVAGKIKLHSAISRLCD